MRAPTEFKVAYKLRLCWRGQFLWPYYGSGEIWIVLHASLFLLKVSRMSSINSSCSFRQHWIPRILNIKKRGWLLKGMENYLCKLSLYEVVLLKLTIFYTVEFQYLFYQPLARCLLGRRGRLFQICFLICDLDMYPTLQRCSPLYVLKVQYVRYAYVVDDYF